MMMQLIVDINLVKNVILKGNNMSILTETQLDRDEELSMLLGIPLKAVQKFPIAEPDSICICNEEKAKIITPEEYYKLYSEYTDLNWPAYLRTLMKTSATRRHPDIFKLLKETKNKDCLDFGSGVGTHALALLENGNTVGLLDVPGKLLNFAGQRIALRGLYDKCGWYFNWMDLPDNCYDVVICTDVLEHVEDPIKELCRIRRTLKISGVLHIQVSTMIKSSSGHFASSINRWKEAGPSYLKKYFKKEGATIWRKMI